MRTPARKKIVPKKPRAAPAPPPPPRKKPSGWHTMKARPRKSQRVLLACAWASGDTYVTVGLWDEELGAFAAELGPALGEPEPFAYAWHLLPKAPKPPRQED